MVVAMLVAMLLAAAPALGRVALLAAVALRVGAVPQVAVALQVAVAPLRRHRLLPTRLPLLILLLRRLPRRRVRGLLVPRTKLPR